MPSKQSSANRQRGGFVIGLIVGLLIGLGIAAAVALYVNKFPVPFVDKLPQRSAEQDKAEAERNKDWNPNAGLNGNGVARPASAPSAGGPALPRSTDRAIVIAPGATRAAGSSRDPAAILSAQPSSAPAAETFVYYVQVGAYGRTAEAEQQRAKLAMAGFESKITEREQAGKTVYRVRVGPFDKRGDAESTQDRLAGSGVEAALVRVQK